MGADPDGTAVLAGAGMGAHRRGTSAGLAVALARRVVGVTRLPRLEVGADALLPRPTRGVAAVAVRAGSDDGACIRLGPVLGWDEGKLGEAAGLDIPRRGTGEKGMLGAAEAVWAGTGKTIGKGQRPVTTMSLDPNVPPRGRRLPNRGPVTAVALPRDCGCHRGP